MKKQNRRTQLELILQPPSSEPRPTRSVFYGGWLASVDLATLPTNAPCGEDHRTGKNHEGEKQRERHQATTSSVNSTYSNSSASFHAMPRSLAAFRMDLATVRVISEPASSRETVACVTPIALANSPCVFIPKRCVRMCFITFIRVCISAYASSCQSFDTCACLPRVKTRSSFRP